MSIANLIKKVQLLNGGLPFMEGKDKGEITLNTIMNIIDFGFLKGDDGEYVVFTTKEDNTKFFFGGMVLTEKMKELEKMLDEKEMQQLMHEGLEVIFGEAKSEKNKRTYTTVEFFPNSK